MSCWKYDCEIWTDRRRREAESLSGLMWSILAQVGWLDGREKQSAVQISVQWWQHHQLRN